MRGVVLLQGVCILLMGGGRLESGEAVGKWEGLLRSKHPENRGEGSR